MFPIRDHNPSERTPYVRNGLIFLNVLLYLLTDPLLGGMTGIWDRLALYPAAVMHGEWPWGIVTHMFLHAGLLHIAGNMLFLWVFGDNLEDQMGHAGFLLFYLACGVAAAIGQIAGDPQSTIPMVGASGAIAGVMGGYLLLFPKARVEVIAIIIIIIKRFIIPAWVLLLAWFGLQLFSTALAQDDGVAHIAHAAGFVAGIIFAVPVFLRLGGRDFWRITQGRPPHLPLVYTPSRIPEVRR
ncbi:MULTISPECIES: rhomboid family intramembrane serine protease [Paracoccus]|uniref:Rhomboid family intramembrane serine protease n=1 Tax=Paracoccus litorisediminis TaxID=2006130 RepID=A0A844HJF8_9RHOB|nr:MULTISPECIES: rhomboid family intramembrane serine protease [Paracoccus]MBD9526114.1 rhomboid family intramembrane serine protease [Paracoccus sp. PAR01]MTH58564.1 rhomboid family intramembrane serine protease [Paracoccus litorisediminis]